MEDTAITAITATIKVNAIKQRPSFGFPGIPSEEWARFKDDLRHFLFVIHFLLLTTLTHRNNPPIDDRKDISSPITSALCMQHIYNSGIITHNYKKILWRLKKSRHYIRYSYIIMHFNNINNNIKIHNIIK